jgi:hypothetical protein
MGVVVDDGTLIATCGSIVGDAPFVEVESGNIYQRGYILSIDKDLAIILIKDKLKPAVLFKGKVTNGQFILAAGRLESDTRMDMKIGHVEGFKPAGMEIVAEVTNKHVGGPILSEGGYLMGIVKDPANLSEDGLTSVTAIYWISEDHYQQFKLDPIIIEYITLPRLKYNKSVNIIQTKRETNIQV